MFVFKNSLKYSKMLNSQIYEQLVFIFLNKAILSRTLDRLDDENLMVSNFYFKKTILKRISDEPDQQDLMANSK